MILSPEHAQEFLNLYKPLLQFIFLKGFREEVKSLENYTEARDILFEDDPPDLILSFALWQADTDDIRSLILMRTPEYEVFLYESERGVRVSNEAYLNEEDDMLKKIEFGDDLVRIITNLDWI